MDYKILVICENPVNNYKHLEMGPGGAPTHSHLRESPEVSNSLQAGRMLRPNHPERSAWTGMCLDVAEPLVVLNQQWAYQE